MRIAPRLCQLSALVLCLALVAACSPAKPKPHSLTLHILGEPSILNPVLSTDTASSTIEGLIFNGLLRVNHKLELEPDLAESYQISPDETTVTFKLKHNVKWHDGHPFTADDVAFTLTTFLDPKTRTVRRSEFVVDGTPIKATVIDPYTISFHSPKPYAPLLTSLAFSILPKHLLEGKDINTATFNRAPIGTGPFKFNTWQSGQYVRVTTFDGYFGKKSKLTGITVKIIPDNNTALVALQKNEIDACDITPKDLGIVEKLKQLNLFEYDALQYTYLGFNLRTPLFSDIRVRKAIAHGIDRQMLLDRILKGHGRVAHLPSSPVLWTYPQSKVPTLEFDPEKSKALLKEAGYSFNPRTKFFEKNGKPLSFTLMTNKGNKDREKTAQFIQQYLQAIGIQVNLQVMEFSSMVKLLNAPVTPKKFDAVIMGWALGIEPDCKSLWHSSEYPAGFNFVGYHNDEVDQLIEEGRRTLNKDKRKEVYQKLYTTIANDVPYVFLFYPKTITGIHKKVKGLAKPGPAGLMNPIEDVRIEP